MMFVRPSVCLRQAYIVIIQYTLTHVGSWPRSPGSTKSRRCTGSTMSQVHDVRGPRTRGGWVSVFRSSAWMKMACSELLMHSGVWNTVLKLESASSLHCLLANHARPSSSVTSRLRAANKLSRLLDHTKISAFTARRSYTSAVLGVIILSVCVLRACFVAKPNNALRIFWYHSKGQSL